MEDEFKFLRAAGVIFKGLAVISAIFFLIVSVIVLFGGGGADTPRMVSLVFLLGGFFYFFIFLSIAEICRILMRIFDNVDKTLDLLEGKAD
ncbi:MAG: hypothetical protein DRP78_04695 [Candidatus Omnitrophota bacterium]|nr:MAG: hypothetical protein DRP78_04695 [Candidatus Omnitrophota bacterium]